MFSFGDRCHAKLRLSKLWQRQGAAIILRVLLIYLRESSSGTSDLGFAEKEVLILSPSSLKTIYGVE
jgi:hypothetical protein